jgi:hypothetical protein
VTLHHRGNQMESSMTSREAYAAMFVFLEEVYKRTHSADIGVLLGGMSLLTDGGTVDPAAWADWEAAVRRVREDDISLVLNLK